MPSRPRALPRAARLAVAALLLVACKRSEEAAAGAPAPATPAATTTESGGAVAPAVPMAAMRVDSSLTARADVGRIDGAASAPVWLVMVSDFQCPYCKLWHDSTYPAVARDYVRTGKIRIAYVNFPLPSHAHAWPSAEAAMCAGTQGKFWAMQDALFATQEQWAKLPDATAHFASLAQAAGVAMPAWRACMTTHATRSIIESDARRAESAGINSTPSFIIGNQLVSGAVPLEQFRPVLDSALAVARRGGTR